MSGAYPKVGEIWKEIASKEDRHIEILEVNSHAVYARRARKTVDGWVKWKRAPMVMYLMRDFGTYKCRFKFFENRSDT